MTPSRSRRRLAVHAAVLAVTALLLVPGCVTRELWTMWPEQAVAPPPSTPTPVRLERAVRTGTGAFHVQATYSDGSSRHLVVRPFDDPGAGAGAAWPDAIRRANVLEEVEGPLPTGSPLIVADAAVPPAQAWDQVLVASDEVGPPETISLERGALRVVNPVTGGWTLATFAPTSQPEADDQEQSTHLRRVVVIGLTPLAAVIDTVIGLIAFGPLAPVTMMALGAGLF